MLIELIGCTSAGKSTLARDILRACRERDIELLMGDDFVLKQVRLDWVKGSLARTLLMDLLLSFVCLVTWQNNLEFCAFAGQIILRLPIGRLEKLNMARNVLKKIGVYEIIRRRGSDQQVVLVDEGTLHAAHYLFVHVSVPPNASDVATFARLAPLPDVAIYVRQSEVVLIERTLKRGHKRIPDCSYAKVEIFIKRAVETFDKLVEQPMIERRLLVVDNQRQHCIRPDEEQL